MLCTKVVYHPLRNAAMFNGTHVIFRDPNLMSKTVPYLNSFSFLTNRFWFYPWFLWVNIELKALCAGRLWFFLKKLRNKSRKMWSPCAELRTQIRVDRFHHKKSYQLWQNRQIKTQIKYIGHHLNTTWQPASNQHLIETTSVIPHEGGRRWYKHNSFCIN